MDSFVAHYRTEFGFILSGRSVIVDDVRVRGIGKSEITLDDKVTFNFNCMLFFKVLSCIIVI